MKNSLAEQRKIAQALTDAAALRGGQIDKEAKRLYLEKLSEEPVQDVLMAIEKLGELKRQEFESAIPDVGSLLALVRVCTVARRNREAANREIYQQQICPRCNSVVGMMVQVGAQMRTWCMPCQQYRRIAPDDLKLTAEQWAAVCGALASGYAEWRKRGAKHHESVSPVDRATAWPVNGLGPVYEIDAFTPDGLPARQ